MNTAAIQYIRRNFPMSSQVLAFCENYRKEISSLNLPERFPDVDLIFFPVNCGQPPADWRQVQKKITKNLQFNMLHVASSACMSGIPQEHQAIFQQHNCILHQCHHLLLNPCLVDFYVQQGYYLVTPGWLERWPQLIAQWGFDQHTAKQFFQEAVRGVLLLDTGIYPDAQANLAAFSEYTGLDAQSIPVGLEYLDLLVSNTILKSRHALQRAKDQPQSNESRKELANFFMALDLLNNLARLQTEDGVLKGIKEMFFMLFGPRAVEFQSTKELLAEHHSKHLEAQEMTNGFVLPVSGASGMLGQIQVSGLNHPEYQGRYKQLAAKIVDICGLAIENARHYQEIRKLSNTDGLTGLANRRLMEEHLQLELRRMERQQAFLALVMLDIDFFKEYNDNYGHQAGDACLKRVASLISSHCRRPGDLAARYGGEEFLLVLSGTPVERAGQIAESLRLEVLEAKIPHAYSRCSNYLTISLGVAAAIPDTGYPIQNLLGKADQAMYNAKRQGRNRVSIMPDGN